jgi:hypothetical protein
MKSKALVMVVLGCALLWTATAAAAPGQKEQKIKTGKKAEITLTQVTTVGDLTLQPGKYAVQHRMSGNDHFMHFTLLKPVVDLNMVAETMGWYTRTEEVDAGEAKCRIEPAGTTIEATAAPVATQDGSPEITEVSIKGENVVHVF